MTQDRAGNRDPLPLSAREADPTFAELGAVLLRQGLQKGIGVRSARCMPYRFVTRLKLSVADVFERRT